MKERPILFNTEMVRAVLDGRKTQTRRVVKPQHPVKEFMVCSPDDRDLCRVFPGEWAYGGNIGAGWCEERIRPCPYGQPGDRLWVRETHARYGHGVIGLHSVHYMADGPLPTIDERHDASLLRVYPSIHMPRWASRITLEVTAVRVERVQDISYVDAVAEGIQPRIVNGRLNLDARPMREVDSFRDLWNSIYAKQGFGWGANPWVWVVEFERVEADQ